MIVSPNLDRFAFHETNTKQISNSIHMHAKKKKDEVCIYHRHCYCETLHAKYFMITISNHSNFMVERSGAQTGYKTCLRTY
jgi:hypothetical protein